MAKNIQKVKSVLSVYKETCNFVQKHDAMNKCTVYMMTFQHKEFYSISTKYNHSLHQISC